MAKLHEILAAEKTPAAAWEVMRNDTQTKFVKADQFFRGLTKSLTMTQYETDGEKENLEAAAREDKPVTTNVLDTLKYALDIFAKNEDLQYAKNKTNQNAIGTVMFRGAELLKDLPIDELMGLEARLGQIRTLFLAMPTLDASKRWVVAEDQGKEVWEVVNPEVTTKTEKKMIPIVLADATDKHPAQVKESTRDVPVGRVTIIRRSGEVTALQKAESIKLVDELITEVKMARQRANATDVVTGNIGTVLVVTLLSVLTDKEFKKL